MSCRRKLWPKLPDRRFPVTLDCPGRLVFCSPGGRGFFWILPALRWSVEMRSFPSIAQCLLRQNPMETRFVFCDACLTVRHLIDPTVIVLDGAVSA